MVLFNIKTKLRYYRLKVIVLVKSSGCLQIFFVIIDYICNFLILPSSNLKSLKSLKSVSISLTSVPL